MVDIYACLRCWHVGAFGHSNTSVPDQDSGIISADFILSRTRKGKITWYSPRVLSLIKLYAISIGIRVYPAALFLFKLFYKFQFFGIDAVQIENKS